ncbi:MAG: hypothetical protein WAV05_17825 [Anaerolineales bacterium]
MDIYDFCVAWNWVYDADFIGLIDQSCQSRGLSLLQITPGNLPQILNSLVERELSCRVFFDRASDEDPQFLPLVQWVGEDSILSINEYERAERTWDKAEMHSLLISQGVNVPPTIILPPFIEQPELPNIDLLSLGDQFTIKPAHGSGGVGVMTSVTSWDQVLTVRKEHATDHYLLQAHVIPQQLDLHPAWFRIIFCAGQIFPCWWDPSSHIYSLLTAEQISHYSLDPLIDITNTIADLCQLDLFSTEIAYTSDGLFVVVDYVNDQIDLRLQSSAAEGVPDAIVRAIADLLVGQFVYPASDVRQPQTLSESRDK